MRIKNLNRESKLYLLILTPLLICLLFLLIQIPSVVKKDQLDLLRDSLAKQTGVVSLLAKERVAFLKKILGEIASKRESFNDSGRFFEFYGDPAYSWMAPFGWITLAKMEKDDLKVLWTLQNKHEVNMNWEVGYTSALIQSLGLAESSEEAVTFERLSDPKGDPLFGMVVPVKWDQTKGVIIGLVSQSVMKDLMVAFKGSVTTAFVVNDSGFVLAHPTEPYFGNLLSEHSIVKALLNQEWVTPDKSYTDLMNEPILGHYHKIEGTNIYAVLTALASEVQRSYQSIILNLIIALLVMGALSFGLSRWGFQWIQKEFKQLSKQTHVPIDDLNGEDENESMERMSLLPQLSPLSSVPLNTQNLDQNKLSKAEMIYNTQSIIPEPPSFKESSVESFPKRNHSTIASKESPILNAHLSEVENFSKKEEITKERILNKENDSKDKNKATPQLFIEVIDLSELMNESLELMNLELEENEIKVEAQLSKSFARLSRAPFLRMATHLIKNSIHAMAGSEIKRLKIATGIKQNEAFLIIEDTGCGMNQQKLTHIYDSLKNQNQNRSGFGLGLTLLEEILNISQGNIKITSKIGEGTCFELGFKAEEELLPVIDSHHPSELEAMLNEMVDGIVQKKNLKKDNPKKTSMVKNQKNLDPIKKENSNLLNDKKVEKKSDPLFVQKNDFQVKIRKPKSKEGV